MTGLTHCACSCIVPNFIMALYQAMVKSVLSGDTVVLHNVNNPKQERVLSLAFVSAPRIRREGDEVSHTLVESLHAPVPPSVASCRPRALVAATCGNGSQM